MLKSVMIDSREPKNIRSLTFGGIPTVVTALEAGDVWAVTEDDKLLVIERKAAGDLLNTISQNRLFAQAAKLVRASKWAYLVIVGDLSRSPDNRLRVDRRTVGWSWDAVQGALLTVQELGVGVIIADDFEKAVIRLGQRKHSDIRLKKPTREALPLSAGEAVLAAFPGIGDERLDALIKYTGTPAWALVYLTDTDPSQDNKVPGIGPGTRARIRRVLCLEDSERLIIDSPIPQEGNSDQAEK